ncbi:MAG: hypothetical protein A2X58_00755 [Nitrospirae bacterium GWC2_56_14]|nr:MAG: hypothetical protein A2X58_00755 [Nitrospirae bacterium GWC2_56_14]
MKKAVLILVLSALFVSCGGGGGSAPVPITSHSVDLNWAPNHERGVNSAGGGYQVSISGQTTINVPYDSGLATTPTTTTVVLNTGAYTVTVRAYAALDALGGSTGNVSAESSPITVYVP